MTELSRSSDGGEMDIYETIWFLVLGSILTACVLGIVSLVVSLWWII